METFLNIQKEFNITTVSFLTQDGEKIGQLVYEIINNKVIIYNTYIYPEYRRVGILKTHFPTILSSIKQTNISLIELSVVCDDAKKAWIHLGFKEITPGLLRMYL